MSIEGIKLSFESAELEQMSDTVLVEVVRNRVRQARTMMEKRLENHPGWNGVVFIALVAEAHLGDVDGIESETIVVDRDIHPEPTQEQP